MAKIYGEIAASGKLTFDKSFARSNGQPLDASEVYYSLEAAQNYAKTAVAYVGQKIVVIEDNVVTQYYIADAAGTLEELGKTYVGDGETITVENGVISFIGEIPTPTGDSKTIIINDDNTISLYGIDPLDFDRDILDEKGEVIGTEKIQYQPLLTKDGLVWIEPSKTTVEGLATLIESLTKRVDQAEKDIDELQAIALKPSEGATAKPNENLWDAIDAEVTRATDAENALDGKINAMYTNAEIDELIQEAKDYADENDDNDNTTYTISYEEKVDGEDGHPARIKLTPSVGEASYVDATPFIKDGMLDKVEYDADTNTLTFTFNTDAGKEEIPVELTDILAPYAGVDGDRIKVTVDGNSIKADLKEGTITKAYLDANVQASLDKADSAIQSLADYTTTKDLEDLLEGKQDVAPEGKTYAYTSDVATAKGEAIADTVEKLKSYYTKDEINGLNHATTQYVDDAKAEAKKYTDDEIAELKIADYAKTSEVTNAINEAKTELQGYADQAEADAITTAGTNADTKISNKVGAIEGTVKDYVDGVNNTLTGKINGLGSLATKNEVSEVELAETLKTKINGKADSATTLRGYGITDAYTKQEVTDAISKAKGEAATDATTKANTAKTEAITAAAEDAALKYATIGTVNELKQTVTNNANNRYTKAEVDAITGTPAEGKTLVQMIADVQKAAAYDDTKVKADIQKNADAIAAEVERATKAEVELSDRIGVKAEGENASTGVYAYVDGIFTTAFEGISPEKIDSLNELVEWANTHAGDVELIKEDIEENATNIGLNTEAIEAVEDRLDVVEPQLVKATLTEAEDGTVTATTGFITPEDNKFEMTDGKVTGVSTDLLFNGVNTLVLFGGSATA